MDSNQVAAVSGAAVLTYVMQVLFEVAKPDDAPYEPPSEDDSDDSRFVRYELNADFLRLRNVGAT